MTRWRISLPMCVLSALPPDPRSRNTGSRNTEAVMSWLYRSNHQDLIALRTEQGMHTLVPGLTGWTQVNGRNELPIL